MKFRMTAVEARMLAKFLKKGIYRMEGELAPVLTGLQLKLSRAIKDAPIEQKQKLEEDKWKI